MDFKIDGIQHVQKKLSDLSGRIKQLDGNHNVPMSELLTPEFLSGCSKFHSLTELFTGSGFSIKSQEDFKAIPDDEWDRFIRLNTSFAGWREMLHAATAAWTKKKLAL